MKKILFILLSVVLTGVANAQFSGTSAPVTGGFEGPGVAQSFTTVKEALAAKDDASVILRGNITNSLGDEKYTFQDSTGEVVVEIDDDKWNGMKVTPENTVEIYGEVDKEIFEQTQIDVKSIVVK